MLQIINFLDTPNKSVLVYEWDSFNGDICTDAQIFDDKQQAYIYWKNCNRTYTQQQIDKLKILAQHLKQPIPKWAEECWSYFDIDFAKINIDEFRFKLNNKDLLAQIDKVKTNAKQSLNEFTKLKLNT